MELVQDLGLLFLFGQRNIGNTDNCSICNPIHQSDEITYTPYEAENIIEKWNVKRLNIDVGIKMLVQNTFEPKC